MNLHSVAGPIVAAVNPTTTGTVRINAGTYTTAATGKRTPDYTDQEDVPLQVQALTGPELKQLDGLNVQGTMRGVYIFGDIEAVARPRNKGGDLLIWDSRTWLVVKVLETWPGWCKVAVVEQTDGS